MAWTMDATYVQTYERTVRHLAQQSVTRLRPWVQERGESSTNHNWDRLGSAEASAKTGREVATPNDEYPWSRRQNVVKTMHTGEVVQKEEIVQMLIEPKSNLAMSQAMAMRRAFDDEIIAKAVADTALDGTGTPAAFGGTSLGTSAAPVAFTYDLITEVSESFMDHDIDPDEEKVIVITPSHARKLLQLTEATSGDYNAARPLTSKGYIESWMGFTWIVHTNLPRTSSTTGNSAFAMTRRAMGLNVNKDIWTRVAEDASISFDWRVYAAATFGACRVEDEQIVRIFALGDATP